MEINFSLVDVEFSLHLWLGTEQHLCPPQAAVAALKIDCGLHLINTISAASQLSWNVSRDSDNVPILVNLLPAR